MYYYFMFLLLRTHKFPSPAERRREGSLGPRQSVSQILQPKILPIGEFYTVQKRESEKF